MEDLFVPIISTWLPGVTRWYVYSLPGAFTQLINNNYMCFLPPSLMCHPHLLGLQVRRPPRLSGLFTSVTSKAGVYKMQSACVRASARDLDSSRAPSTIQRCRRRPGEHLEDRRHACGHRGPRLRCWHQHRNAREGYLSWHPGGACRAVVCGVATNSAYVGTGGGDREPSHMDAPRQRHRCQMNLK